jgi:hypothetical protein
MCVRALDVLGRQLANVLDVSELCIICITHMYICICVCACLRIFTVFLALGMLGRQGKRAIIHIYIKCIYIYTL